MEITHLKLKLTSIDTKKRYYSIQELITTFFTETLQEIEGLDEPGETISLKLGDGSFSTSSSSITTEIAIPGVSVTEITTFSV